MKLVCKDQKPAVLNAVDQDGMTAAHWCAFHNHWKHLDCLVAEGADIHIKDNEGKMPVHWTNNNQDETTIQYFVENVTNSANEVDAEGRTSSNFEGLPILFSFPL